MQGHVADLQSLGLERAGPGQVRHGTGQAGLERQTAGGGGGRRGIRHALGLRQVQASAGLQVQAAGGVAVAALEIQLVAAQAQVAVLHCQVLLGEIGGEFQDALDGPLAPVQAEPGHLQVHPQLVGAPALAQDMEAAVAPGQAPGRLPHMGLAVADLQVVQTDRGGGGAGRAGLEPDLGQPSAVQIQLRAQQEDVAEVRRVQQAGPFQVHLQQVGPHQIAAQGQVVQADLAAQGVDLQPLDLHAQPALPARIAVQLGNDPAIHRWPLDRPSGKAAQGRARGDQVGHAAEPAAGPESGRVGRCVRHGVFSPQEGHVTARRGRGR